ncbi:MAG TPA: SprT family zinc-dependent metalloprotease [Candidatus Brocadia sapporoensis]|nr:M48 family metallopeptidase [Candidatus Brocadia sp.]HQU31949.1 SprT family zinc-dependent metalloprotease [Candidatus Brocadia sapporoensis]
MSIDMQQIKLSNMRIDVIQKDIKNIHLSVYPPAGRVRISAPLRMDLETIRVFAISKLSWIKKQQQRLLRQEREAPRECLTRESHYYMGKRCLMKVIEHNAAPRVILKHSAVELYVRPHTSIEKKRIVLEEWYRRKLKEIASGYVEYWMKKMRVEDVEYAIKKMKTKWGSCSREAKRIWLNLELAKKPKECIEYIIVHEMVHLLERHHNERFIAYMDNYLPKWRFYKEELNRSPLRHENWDY